MSDLRKYKEDAQYLSSCISTVWLNYDFSKLSSEAKKRIPQLVFNRNNCDVDVKENPPKHFGIIGYEKFSRNYEVTYKDNHYLFVTTVSVPFGCVQSFFLDIYLVKDSKKIKLISERL